MKYRTFRSFFKAWAIRQTENERGCNHTFGARARVQSHLWSEGTGAITPLESPGTDELPAVLGDFLFGNRPMAHFQIGNHLEPPSCWRFQVISYLKVEPRKNFCTK